MLQVHRHVHPKRLSLVLCASLLRRVVLKADETKAARLNGMGQDFTGSPS